jgi:hypothetical protein
MALSKSGSSSPRTWCRGIETRGQDAAIASLVLEKARAVGLGRIWFRKGARHVGSAWHLSAHKRGKKPGFLKKTRFLVVQAVSGLELELGLAGRGVRALFVLGHEARVGPAGGLAAKVGAGPHFGPKLA